MIKTKGEEKMGKLHNFTHIKLHTYSMIISTDISELIKAGKM